MTWVWSWSLRDARAIPAVNRMATALFRAGALVDGMVASFISVQPIVFKEPPTGLVLCARFTMTPIGDSFDVECAMGGVGARRYRIEARTPYGSGDRSSVMEKFLNLVRSNNMVQAVLCIAFGLFLIGRCCGIRKISAGFLKGTGFCCVATILLVYVFRFIRMGQVI